MRRLADIRHTFLDFFSKNGHEVVPSSSLIPKNDPTLLFTNAGMVQFKDVFTGVDKRSYSRATSSQKCIRAGGKHNDLENVGYTARHHTFFEMLGNFSFGDYFKEEAIYYAWTMITQEFNLDKERLVVTVYHDDDEAYMLWKKIANFPDHKIIRIASADNFWSMGETGPCGPCTEIFYDHGEGIPGGPPGSPDEDGDRFVEFWNLVFMQYDQQADGSRILLPKPSVDTGMGIERFTSILQGVHNNYETDLFRALIDTSMELTKSTKLDQIQSHRVIADHLRSASFLLADGILPSNEGRGYVLRRIMRRGMRHAHLLGAKEPLLYRMVPALVDLMSSAYPELLQSQDLIIENLKLEEERFRQTLERGLRLLEDETSRLSSDSPLPGDVAFKLYDTYGFPLDLTQDVLRGQNRTVEIEGFNSAMKAQQESARAAWSGSGETKNDQVWFDLKNKINATEFLGYESTKGDGIIQALVKDGVVVDSLQKGEQGYLLTNQTPCYGESGGQQGDRGWILGPSGKAEILDTQKMLGIYHVHTICMTDGSITLQQIVKISVDDNRRRQLKSHHSATHLLHSALRRILGEHVVQKGSLVAEDRLRFDFTHNKALTPEEIKQIERDVNNQILLNVPVQTHIMSPEEAIKKGAMSLFGEKYGDEVRVLSMGEVDDLPYSVELCGGTHVYGTGEIGLFKIISENGISAGIRRIEAVSGPAAIQYINDMQAALVVVTEALKCGITDVSEKLPQILRDKKNLEKQLNELRKKVALSSHSSSHQENSLFKTIGQFKLVRRELIDIPAKDLKPLADQLKTEVGSGIVVLTSVVDGKVALVIGVTPDLSQQVDAVELVRKGSDALGGKGGGGRPDMAQAGGNDPSLIPNALKAVEDYLLTL